MAVAKLNEYAQKARLDLRYEDVGCDGLDHIRTFTVRAVLDGKTYDGVGKNKKEAKLKAAENAFSVLSEGTIDPTEKTTEASAAPTDQTSIPQAKYTCWLNEYGQQKRSDIRAVESTRLGPTGATQCCRFVVGDKEYPAATGRTKKDAKEEAAKLVYHEICGGNTTEDAVKEQNMGKSQNEPSIPSRFTSDFDSMEYLGSGAFGHVYKARHTLLERYYAVKVVCREEKSLREVGTLSELLHCNIVRYYTFWMEDSGYQGNSELTECSAVFSSSQTSNNSSAKYLYIQMELCDTKTLKEWIEEKNTQSLQDSKRREEGLSIAQQIVSGVEYIHSKKHIHRDLKPENILFGLNGEVKIGDFGLVTRDDDDDDALMERTGQRGTTTYMAPEQREKNYDRKVDIFPLGLIYFELLWKLSTVHERGAVWDDARSQKLPEEFSLTFPQENQIIESMLHEKPEDRPEASKLKAEMEMCAQTLNKQNTHQEDETV
uniref:non-specific serine/threonine protein kinase n=1 Tax=Cyclopterus lumpus TaxID=8103 RepID=A0A8C3AW13_CYCLU